MQILALILAGAARATVGGGWVNRGYVYPPAALLAAYLGFGLSWWGLVFGAVAATTFFLGRTDWSNTPYMVGRYGAFPALLALFYFWRTADELPLYWAAGCLVLGWLDGRIRVWVREHSWTIKGYVIDSARIAEYVDGCVVMGALALL